MVRFVRSITHFIKSSDRIVQKMDSVEYGLTANWIYNYMKAIYGTEEELEGVS